jgi:hypothetical protein
MEPEPIRDVEDMFTAIREMEAQVAKLDRSIERMRKFTVVFSAVVVTLFAVSAGFFLWRGDLWAAFQNVIFGAAVGLNFRQTIKLTRANFLLRDELFAERHGRLP